MFIFNRSIAAVLLPIALLVAVVAWSNLADGPSAAAVQAKQPARATLVARAGEEPRKGS